MADTCHIHIKLFLIILRGRPYFVDPTVTLSLPYCMSRLLPAILTCFSTVNAIVFAFYRKRLFKIQTVCETVSHNTPLISVLRRSCMFWGEPLQVTLTYCCGQTVGWITMPLGTQAGLGPGDIMLDGSHLPSPKGAQPPNFRPMSIVARWLDGLRCHLVWR